MEPVSATATAVATTAAAKAAWPIIKEIGGGIGKYILPSFITGGLSALGGTGAAKLQERSADKQMAWQTGENQKSRLVDLYNIGMEQAWAEYADKKDAVRMKRLRGSLINAFRDAVSVGGPGMIMPYTPTPQAPQPQQVAQQTRGIGDILLAGR